MPMCGARRKYGTIQCFCDANLNEMETIDVEPIIVEDERGEIVEEL